MTRPPSPPDRARVIRQALSVSVATGMYGVSFGALAIAAGLNLWQTMALSLLMFTGGSQFALIGVVGAGGTPLAAIATAGLLGVRNGLYGAQLGPLLGFRGLRRIAAAHITIDESTAVATAQTTQPLRRTGFWWAGLGVFIGWNTMTLVGALIGNALGDPKAWGLDAAAAAAFLGLLWPRLASRSAQACAAIAVVIACALIPVAPAGVPVLAAASAAILVGAWEVRRHPNSTPPPPEMPNGATSPPEVSNSATHPPEVSNSATHPPEVSNSATHPPALCNGAAPPPGMPAHDATPP
ncbi:MAG: AzlC family ABC transporter permease, partial [Propionibacteriaceae bacterium]|nr:AzlC family ABC transporter permease [Propionibacteriaceae bacterium]